MIYDLRRDRRSDNGSDGGFVGGDAPLRMCRFDRDARRWRWIDFAALRADSALLVATFPLLDSLVRTIISISGCPVDAGKGLFDILCRVLAPEQQHSFCQFAIIVRYSRFSKRRSTWLGSLLVASWTTVLFSHKRQCGASRLPGLVLANAVILGVAPRVRIVSLQGDTFSISPGFLGAYMGDSEQKVP
eukprot:SAG31_NODE_1053_length_10144_cov_117.540866_5_plen_188_part_00